MSLYLLTNLPVMQVRQEIKKAKLELSFELGRLPTEEEIVDRVGISLERYHEVMKASKPVLSLNARHVVTQEEFINGITDIDVGGDKCRQPAVLRLALDDVVSVLQHLLKLFQLMDESPRTQRQLKFIDYFHKILHYRAIICRSKG